MVRIHPGPPLNYCNNKKLPLLSNLFLLLEHIGCTGVVGLSYLSSSEMPAKFQPILAALDSTVDAVNKIRE